WPPLPRKHSLSCVFELLLGENRGMDCARKFFAGGDRVHDCALPGFDARYLARAPGVNSGGKSQKHPCRICRRPVGPRSRKSIVMASNLMLAPRQGAGRSDLPERRLRRYHPCFQGMVRTLATRHSRIADLAVSFPALLFALAVPRPGM